LLDFQTRLDAQKQLKQVKGSFTLARESHQINGYEIHCGVTTGSDLNHALIQLDDGRKEGVVSSTGQVIGTYLHGVFDHAESCQALLKWAGLSKPKEFDYEAFREAELDRLADLLEEHVDVDTLLNCSLG